VAALAALRLGGEGGVTGGGAGGVLARLAWHLERPDHRWRLAGLLVAAAVVCAGKHYYRHASADDLAWILAPTAHLVSLVRGAHFVHEAGAGWIDRELTFIIAPSCAGLNFALAAFLALALGWCSGMRSARSTAVRLGLAAALALVATLIVNTARIVVAIAIHRGEIDLGQLDRAEVHRIEGILVYLGGLCALYAVARALEARRRGDALAH
jgi:exosortase K